MALSIATDEAQTNRQMRAAEGTRQWQVMSIKSSDSPVRFGPDFCIQITRQRSRVNKALPKPFNHLRYIKFSRSASQLSAAPTSISTKQPNNNQIITIKMKCFAAATAFFAGAALAAPALETRQTAYVPCSGLYGTSQCCATDVLGVADLDCANPPTVPTDAASFTSICSEIGQRARCCVLPILGQDVLCQTPAGVTV
ncbi:Cerato-ulmin hydrophobin family [Hypomontagnella submonticulosa]|nr:Cerato-ulmin hydrophobin family [Hypomontagnella submonticulosa]